MGSTESLSPLTAPPDRWSMPGRAAFAALVLGLVLGWAGNALLLGTRLKTSARHRDSSLMDRVRIEIWKRFSSRAMVVMVGDSHTDLADWRAMFPRANVVNRGISGDTTGMVLDRLDTILSVGAATAIVMIGTNDVLGGARPEAIEANYRRIVERLGASGARVVLTSTPLTRTPGPNETIARLNADMRAYCAGGRCAYLDLNAGIARDGLLDPGMTLDGVHLNGAGYAVWAAALAPFME